VEDILSQSTLEIMTLALTYGRLASLPNPSNEEQQQLADILAIAIDNEILNFWITEVDHSLGHQMGFLDEDCRESYKDQQALLREHRGEPICITPSNHYRHYIPIKSS
jgi:hypothetical protein